MEYVSFDSSAEVRETFVTLLQKVLAGMPSLSRRIIEQHALPTTDISPERFIPMQRALDMLKHVDEDMGPIVLRQMGTLVIEIIDYPPQIDSVEKALFGINETYRMHHRGVVGHYETSRGADGSLVLRCATPYPREFERGLVEGMCRHRALAQGKRYFVTSSDGAPGTQETCVLTVRPA